MIDIEKKFNGKYELVVTGLVDGGARRQDAVEAVENLLVAYGAMLAEEVRADTKHIRYGSADDYAERHAKLILGERES